MTAPGSGKWSPTKLSEGVHSISKLHVTILIRGHTAMKDLNIRVITAETKITKQQVAVLRDLKRKVPRLPSVPLPPQKTTISPLSPRRRWKTVAGQCPSK